MKRNLLLALGFLLLHAGGLSAQVFTPSFLPPQRSEGVGAYLSGGVGSEDGFAIEGIARRSYGPIDLGLRAGVADLDGAALLIGIEYRNPLPGIWDLPVDLAVTGGAQGLIGHHGGPAVAAGITGGHEFVVPGAVIDPYVNPRIALFERAGSSLRLAPQVELGADVTAASPLRFHIGIGLGAETANLGFGLSWH
jgi:hypothetical protein